MKMSEIANCKQPLAKKKKKWKKSSYGKLKSCTTIMPEQNAGPPYT